MSGADDRWPWSAYTPGETPRSGIPASAPSTLTRGARRRRRPPSETEQARRHDWGRRWGGMIGEFWRQVHESEA